jgi:hypothetical protein
MHPGPMNRGVEIDGTLADDINRSVIQEQVEMGVAVRMAAMDLLARRRNLRLHSEAATAPSAVPENEAEDAPRQKNTAGIAVAVLLGLTLIGFLLLVWARF